MRLRALSPLPFLLAALPAIGCAALEPPSPPEGEDLLEATLTSRQSLIEADVPPHEPLIEMFRQKFATIPARRFSLVEIDRPFKLTFDWRSVPALFRVTGTSPSGAVTTSGELSTTPLLDFTPLPGETTLTIDVEIQSELMQFSANILLEQQILPSELGRCGDRIRDLFVRWAHGRHSWRDNPNFIAVREHPPSNIYFTYSHGVGAYAHNYTLRGVLQGTHGPILQVEEKVGARVALNTLLFFDEQGQLLHKVDGLYFFMLPDGNLLVSKAMADDGPNGYWYLVDEDVMAVSPAGEIVWQRFIGGRPPGRAVMTAAGTLVMPWWNSTSRHAAIHEIDPRTGATANETFIDRSELCTEASTAPTCVDDRARRLARFDTWWQAYWRGYMPDASPATPRKACNRYGCIEGILGGWLTLGVGTAAEDVMEVSTHYTSLHGSERTNSLIFDTASGPRTLGGKLVRRLSPDRLLVSTALAESDFSSGLLWYYHEEELASVGPGAAISWKRRLFATPALVYPAGHSTTHGADGYLLPNNQLLFVGWAARDGGFTANSFWLDLATGVVQTTLPPKRILEGVCVP